MKASSQGRLSVTLQLDLYANPLPGLEALASCGREPAMRPAKASPMASLRFTASKALEAAPVLTLGTNAAVGTNRARKTTRRAIVAVFEFAFGYKSEGHSRAEKLIENRRPNEKYMVRKIR